jgi:hypothetical protein
MKQQKTEETHSFVRCVNALLQWQNFIIKKLMNFQIIQTSKQLKSNLLEKD